LDTNVLIFVLLEEMRSQLSLEVQHILDDYSNRFYVSSVAVPPIPKAIFTKRLTLVFCKRVSNRAHFCTFAPGGSFYRAPITGVRKVRAGEGAALWKAQVAVRLGLV